MTHYWYVNGLKFDVLSIHQDKPQTTVHIKHVGNGVTYEAKRQALWDGDGEWNAEEGVRIAVKRAVRSIKTRLTWEAGLCEDADRLTVQTHHLESESLRVFDALRDISELHRDGGTVEL